MSTAIAERPAVVAPRNAGPFTYADYRKLPEGECIEIVEGGRLSMAPAPTAAHQIVSANLFDILRSNTRQHGGVVLAAPLDVIFDEQNITQPDLLYLAPEHKNLLQSRGIFGAPDLIVEIVSPSSQHRDFVVKHALYQRFGVREYWIVNPGLATIDVLALEGDSYVLHQEASVYADAAADQIATSRLLPTLQVPMESVFADLPG
jgi:Uma2 family endonuclease